MNYSRKDFLRVAGLGLAASALPSSTETFGQTTKIISSYSKPEPFKFGLASYTFREFKLDEVIVMAKRLNLRYIALKDMHLPLTSTPEEIKTLTTKVRDAGLDLYGTGAIYMNNEEEIRKAFEYAKLAGMTMIVGVPLHPFLSLVEKMVKKYNIILAIHNHGPGDKIYPSPESVYDKIKKLDKRIGLCIDIGHTQRFGIDPSEAVAKYADRLYDIHIKDVNAATEAGTTVEMGRGITDIPRLLRALQKANYTGHVSLEYEKDAKDPLVGAAESVGYVRGALAAMAT